jgi:undecaprenyl diphosphate synthase
LDNNNFISKKDFLSLSVEEINKIIIEKGKPKVGVFIPDGTRRSAMFFLGLTPDEKNFENKYISIEGKKFLENVKIMFKYGLHTLFIPSLKHENYERDKKTIDSIIYHAIKSMLIGEEWRNFYKEYKVKVKVYGDIDFVLKKGYPEIIDWINEIEELTKNNKKHVLYHGIACSNRYEIPRLMDLSIDFFRKHGRKPSLKEKVLLYYDNPVEEVDFLIRATVIRDSDIQPPIISGRKTQMYFLVAPNHISFSKELYLEILYDLIFCRDAKYGKKSYNNDDLQKFNLEYLKDYYEINKSKIIGLGDKVGSFWLPKIEIEIPKKKVKQQENKNLRNR